MIKIKCSDNVVDGRRVYFAWADVDGVWPECVAYSLCKTTKEEAIKTCLTKLDQLKKEFNKYEIYEDF